MIKKAQAVALVLLLAVSAFGCSSSYSVTLKTHPSYYKGKATIVGFVSDRKTAELLVGANVFIEGTNLGAATNMDGYYRIDALPAGKYYVAVSYIGYQRFSPFELTAEPDHLIRLDFELVQSTIQVFEQNYPH